jgi:peptide/nickel transport system ATP-binding protein
MTAALIIERLSIELPRHADRNFAVQDFSVSIEPGETLCVIGESGSGKTMAAHAVMGLLPSSVRLTSGAVKLAGVDVPIGDPVAMRRLRGRDIGMVFQEPMTSLNPLMRIGKQMREVFVAHGQGGREVEKRIVGLLAEMGLPDPGRIARSWPHELSGGQRQRVMIAMALALNPKLLIADEPTTALDVTTQAQILKLIDRMREEHGTAVMFITHDFGVVREIAHKVAVLRQGDVVEYGLATPVLETPQHEYSRRLMAAVPSLIPPPPRDLSAASKVLTVERLHKSYGRFSVFGNTPIIKAVDDVSLYIRRGETLGIVGESGSGKSTTARCIVRLIEPEAGEVAINGQSFLQFRGEALRRERWKIQMVFQDPFASLNPRRKAGQIIAEAVGLAGTSATDTKSEVHRLLALVGLSEQAAGRYPHEFSGGQRQRLGVARALAMKPEILIADEAVSALDVSVQARVLELLAELQEKLGISILFVTHDLRVAAQVCDRIAVMQKGRVVELKPTAELFSNPEHPYTRRLFAAIPGGKIERPDTVGLTQNFPRKDIDHE